MTLGANLAQIDADTNLLHQIIHGTAAEDVTTEGGIVPTVAKRLASVGSGVARGAWATATVYALGDIVTNAGTNYRCAIAHTSSAAFATDAALARWVLLAVTTDLMQKSANLSDLANVPTARANLSVYSQAQVDAAVAAALAETAAAEARNTAVKNLFTNATFRLWQRGTSWTGVSSVTTADRWRIGGATGTVTRQRRDTADAAILGARNFIGVGPTAVSAWAFYLAQSIEDVNRVAGRQVTLSFYAKYNTAMSGAGKTISVRPGHKIFDNATNPTVTDAGVGSVSFNDTNTTWQRYSFTFTVPAASAVTLNTTNDSAYADIRLYFNTSAAAYLDIANIQLEIGATATAFSELPRELDVLLCKRFYQRSLPTVESFFANNSANPTQYHAHRATQMVGASISNALIAYVRFPVEMYPRAAGPTVFLVWNPYTASNQNPYNETRSANMTNCAILTDPTYLVGFTITANTVAGSAAGDRLAFHWEISMEPEGGN